MDIFDLADIRKRVGTPYQRDEDVKVLLAIIDGMQKPNEAEISVNEKGGKQSKISYKFTDFSPKVMLRLAARSHLGFSHYGPKNYLKIPIDDHMDHALTHIFNYLSGDMQDGDELAGAVCRIMFAMEIDDLNSQEEKA